MPLDVDALDESNVNDQIISGGAPKKRIKKTKTKPKPKNSPLKKHNIENLSLEDLFKRAKNNKKVSTQDIKSALIRLLKRAQTQK